MILILTWDRFYGVKILLKKTFPICDRKSPFPNFQLRCLIAQSETFRAEKIEKAITVIEDVGELKLTVGKL